MILDREIPYLGEVGIYDSVKLVLANTFADEHSKHGMHSNYRFRFYASKNKLEFLVEPPEDVVNTILDSLSNRGLLSNLPKEGE
jgi:hypothetical protein